MDIDVLLSDALGPARKQLKWEQTYRKQLAENEIDVTSPDRSVTVTQTCAGEVIKVDIAPGTFDKTDEKSFAKLLSATLQAGRRTGRQVAEQLTHQALQGRE